MINNHFLSMISTVINYKLAVKDKKSSFHN